MAVAVLVAMPDPVSKVVAFVLQLLIIAFAVHAAVTEGVAAVQAAQEWWALCKGANGRPDKVSKAADKFAHLTYHLVQAIIASVGVGALGHRGIKSNRDVRMVPSGKDSPKLGQSAGQSADSRVSDGVTSQPKSGQIKDPEVQTAASESAPVADALAAPSTKQIREMHDMDTSAGLKRAAEFARNPNTVYHHNVLKGGTRSILETSTMKGGDGTASFGGGTAVRAWFGEAHISPASPRRVPTVEFTVSEARPDVRLYIGGTPGVKWNVDALKIEIRKVHLPDGRTAIPDSGGYFKVTARDGSISRMHVSEFPE